MKNTLRQSVVAAPEASAALDPVRFGPRRPARWLPKAIVALAAATMAVLAMSSRAQAASAATDSVSQPVMDLVIRRVDLNLIRNSISYDTLINGVTRNVSYGFRNREDILVSVQDDSGADVLSFKVTSKRITTEFEGRISQRSVAHGFVFPEGVDPHTRFALKSQLVALPNLGIAGQIARFVESGGTAPEASSEVTSVVDWFLTIWEVGCTAYSSTASCTTSDGRTQSVTCGCGEVAQCNQISYTICIYITVTVDGEQREVESCETYNECICSCFDPDLDFASGPYSE